VRLVVCPAVGPVAVPVHRNKRLHVGLSWASEPAKVSSPQSTACLATAIITVADRRFREPGEVDP
jgi:ribosomal protein S7